MEEQIEGAIDITRRDWCGLPWDVDPNKCSEEDWIRVLPGTNYLAKIGIRMAGVPCSDRDSGDEEISSDNGVNPASSGTRGE